MFLWLTFPTITNTPSELFEEIAATAQVICVPGDSFFVPHVDDPEGKYKGPPCIRLSFASASPDKIRTAVARLAECLLKK